MKIEYEMRIHVNHLSLVLLQSERKYILALAIFLDPNQSGHIVTLKMIYPCFCLNHKQSLTGRAVFYSYTALSKQNKPAN